MLKKIETLLSSVKYDKALPVKDSEIRLHEENLKIKLGPAYKAFLSEFGCLVVGPNEIYGICGDNDSIPSAIFATMSARKDPKFPKELFVIANDGSGVNFCVDKDDQIYRYDGRKCQPLEKSFENFAVEFLG